MKKEWYCAHAIFYFDLIDCNQESYLVYENVYLVKSTSSASVARRVSKFSKSLQDENERGALTVDGKQARYLFKGIRKIISLEDGLKMGGFQANQDMVELTYSVFELDSWEALCQIASGKMIDVSYVE